MAGLVKPQPLSGFPEWLPGEALVERRLVGIIRREFERAGFTPIETPAVERKEVLQAKGIESKEIYALNRLAAEQEGGDPATEMALHFDLTVPLARYVAQHFAKLTFPFRRSQIQKVWRGERPQAGRFREFVQADIDVIGNGNLSPLNEAEIPVVIAAIFEDFGLGDFTIRLNNRKLLQGLLETVGVGADGLPASLRAVDGLEKVGREATARSLADGTGIDPAAAERLLDLLQDGRGDLDRLAAAGASDLLSEGVAEMRAIAEALAALGMPEKSWTLDPAIARGLDYYTGTVYETRLEALPEIGSVCSGGRYDNLAGTFTRQALPGAGISIGLTRLLARALDAGLLTADRQTVADVLVCVMGPEVLTDCLKVTRTLRQQGFNTEVFLEKKKIGDQLKYAAKKGFPVAIIIGTDEAAAGQVQMKDLRQGDQVTVAAQDLPTLLAARLLSEE